MFLAPEIFFGYAPQNFGPALWNRAYYWPSCKISRRSAHASRRFREWRKKNIRGKT